MTTRQTGGLKTGYKPLIPASASRRWLSLRSSHIAFFTFAAPFRDVFTTYLPLKGSSYSFTLNLSNAISCFSYSSIYFLIVDSLIPTVDT